MFIAIYFIFAASKLTQTPIPLMYVAASDHNYLTPHTI